MIVVYAKYFLYSNILACNWYIIHCVLQLYCNKKNNEETKQEKSFNLSFGQKQFTAND